MTVNLYRRHKPNCLGGHPWQSRFSELEERRKMWKRCDCTTPPNRSTPRQGGESPLFYRRCTPVSRP
jgi:hypothetical protein